MKTTPVVTASRSRGIFRALPAIVAGLCLVAPIAYAGSAPILNPDNGHYYEWVDNGTGLTWDQAQQLAEGRTYEDMTGHLVTVTSAAEESFLASNFPIGTVRYWVGGTDAGSEGQWSWVTGEPWGYENWGPGEPNGGADESCIEYQPVGVVQWNDIPCSAPVPDLLIEYDGAPVPAMPAGALLAMLAALTLGAWLLVRRIG